MNITVIGASAGIGLETVQRALERGHKVTTISRSEISIINENLTSIIGNATNPVHLRKAIENSDAVIVALGTGKSMKATTLYTEFASTLLKVQSEKTLKIPYIIVTGFGAGESKKYAPISIKLALNTLLKNVYANKTEMEKMIVESNLNWTIVRPGMLTDDGLTEMYNIEKKLYKGIKVGKISRSDVADMMVKQAENLPETNSFVTITTN